ncbi:MAG: tRNA (N(6)-L-threonylcarbamoyladenosine(37)-C(2))-methylthiotransferase MtaB, partial [Desulfobacterales bacterium]|nr:tRNA (N(6)-L-threonylcarbamoyladenosine(37)-C(2))-methylthiotransferase MtaB [Desulfobacterales bacterium]
DCGDSTVCIVNTCTVTQKASMQSRQAIRKAIRDNPDARIVVTGCYAQTAPHEISNIDGVDYVVDHDKKMSISRLVHSNGDPDLSPTLSTVGTISDSTQLQPPAVAATYSRTRPFLKIQDGCNAFCTYCIVPYARGRSRSLPMADVLDSIDELAAAGFHEVVLTGIHLGAYGRDLSPPAALPMLLHQIQDLTTIDRVRLSSIEPLELTAEIIETVADSEIFCHHFHVPLQSGDDDILKHMGRPYSRRIFRELIRKIHERLPDAAIGADILIGFPGESESAFRNTLELIADLPLSYLHVFPYSARPGTPAADLPDQVPHNIIRDRCEQLRKLGEKKRRHFYRDHLGKKVSVLVESKRDRESGVLKGVSSNYLPVFIDGDDRLKNKLVDVEIERLEENSLVGVLL